jgi:hypothetical protein
MLPDMHTGHIIKGLKPSWEPLVTLVGRDVVPCFIWAFALKLDDGTEVHAYKCAATRQYVHLAAGGQAFALRGTNGYEEVTTRQALEQAFHGWEDAAPQPRNADAVRALLERHRSATAEAA